jgi:glycosyltransferase involved in cell wall biosynthesis
MAPERKRFYYKKKKKPVNANSESDITDKTIPSDSNDNPEIISTTELNIEDISETSPQIPKQAEKEKLNSPENTTSSVIKADNNSGSSNQNSNTVNQNIPKPNNPNQQTRNSDHKKPVLHKNRLREIKPDQQNTARHMNSGQSISVVIPLLNEEESLIELSASLEKVLSGMRCGYEVIFIDDGSTDRSFSKLKEINRRNSKFHCIKLRRNYGKSAALSKGFSAAKGSIVITMDADLQDDPSEIPELVKVLNSGYDLVSGWKKVRYDPFIKKHTSKLFNYVTSKLSGIKLHDFNCGLKAYKKDVVKSIKMYGEMHRYIPALAYMSGFKVTEKPVKHHARKYGVTKFGASRFVNGFLDLLTVVFTNKYIKRPLHFFGSLGILTSLAGFLITLYLAVLKFVEDKPLSDRPLFLVGIFLIIIGVQFLSLGLIAEMITKSNVNDDDILVEQTI